MGCKLEGIGDRIRRCMEQLASHGLVTQSTVRVFGVSSGKDGCQADRRDCDRVDSRETCWTAGLLDIDLRAFEIFFLNDTTEEEFKTKIEPDDTNAYPPVPSSESAWIRNWESLQVRLHCTVYPPYPIL